MEENTKLVASFVEAVNSKDWDKVRDCFAEGATVRIFARDGGSIPVDGMIEGWKADATAFPDVQRRIFRSFGQDDLVCIEVEETGTHRGPLEHAGRTYPPTWKVFRIRACGVCHIQEHKIAEMCIYCDLREHLMQIGVL